MIEHSPAAAKKRVRALKEKLAELAKQRLSVRQMEKKLTEEIERAKTELDFHAREALK